MQTLSFIGSDKNAGKTTVLCYEYRNLRKQKKAVICLTSIGINGELRDSYDNRPKPLITVYPDTYFITASEHLNRLTSCYRTIASLSGPAFQKHFILAKALSKFTVTIEGPNQRRSLIKAKKTLEALLPDAQLLIDGSVDRQFLADPDISDQFIFALLISDRKEQLQKANSLLSCLKIPLCSKQSKELIEENLTNASKSLLLGSQGQILHQSNKIPFLDTDLLNICGQNGLEDCILYLQGALSSSLVASLAPFSNLECILHNFTLYQNIKTDFSEERLFKPKLSLFHPVKVKAIFLNQQSNSTALSLPAGVPVSNIFREAA